MRRRTLAIALTSAALTAAGAAALPASPRQDKQPPGKDGYVTIFDGKTLKGWHVSSQSGHSRASKNKSGGKWVVEDGTIVGTQDIPGNGGLLITDKQYKDFEIILEMKNDFGPDSGLFMRSNEKGQAYQAMIDYYRGGNLMGLYGEALNPGFHIRNFSFLDSPEKIKEDKAEFKLPVSPKEWPNFWKHGEWNEFKSRIVGQPPHITTWIKGVKFMDWTDPMKRHQDEGGIALQVHGGGDHTREFVRYRSIRVKELNGEK
jgi:hypothetical protein